MGILGVKNNLWNLPILYGGAIVVASCIAELESHLSSIVAVNCHLSEPLCPIMTIKTFQCADCCVVCVWLNF